MITERLQQAAGLEPAAAARLTAAIVRAITEQLPAPDRSTFARKLPAGAARAARLAVDAPCDSLPLFYRRIGTLVGLPEVRVIEATQIVCAALLDALDADGRAWFAARLPEALSALSSLRALPFRLPEPPRDPRRYPTLAQGRPGSAHPLSEAHPDLGHHESIARSDNPHGDIKLASSPGPTQAREHEALADGDPRPSRPLSSGRQ